MIAVFFFSLTLLFFFVHVAIVKERKELIEIFLSYLIFFNIGCMGLMAFYAHIFNADETARMIGWKPGSPFQSEIGMANLSYGILGILSLRFRRSFWLATVLGYSILLLGAFWVHLEQIKLGDIAPYNTGIFLWFGDFMIPLLALGLTAYYYKTIPRGEAS